MAAVDQNYDHGEVKQGRQPQIVGRKLPESKKQCQKQYHLDYQKQQYNSKPAEYHVCKPLFSLFKERDTIAVGCLILHQISSIFFHSPKRRIFVLPPISNSH